MVAGREGWSTGLAEAKPLIPGGRFCTLRSVVRMQVRSKRLDIRPLEAEDAEFLAGLINDPDVRDSLGSYNIVGPISLEAEQKWVEKASVAEDEYNFIVVLRKGSRPIGAMGARDINQRLASAHVSVMLEKASWDKGYGTEALEALVDALFQKLNLHRIWLRVRSENARAIRCYEKVGFVKEGTLRDDHYHGGKWRSSDIMSVLRDEWGRKG